MKNIHLKQAKHKTTITAHLQMMMLVVMPVVVMLAAVAFSAGYYLASLQMASIITK